MSIVRNDNMHGNWNINIYNEKSKMWTHVLYASRNRNEEEKEEEGEVGNLFVSKMVA